MHHLKGFIVTVVGLFVIVTLFSLLIPSTITVAKGVAVNSDRDKVYKEISNLRNWKHWHPAFRSDSVELHFSADSGLNSYCEWQSNGKTSRLQLDSIAADRISVSLSRPGQPTVKSTLRLLPVDEDRRVQVEWRAFIHLKWYPWDKFYGLFIEKSSGEGYEAALNSLKEYVEHH